MANTKTNSSKKKTTKNGNTSTKSKNTTKSSKQQVPVSNSIGFADHFHAFAKTRFFKFCIFILVFAAIIGLDLLISWNKFDTFFLIWGIEVIAAAVFYILSLIIGKNKTSDNDNSNERS